MQRASHVLVGLESYKSAILVDLGHPMDYGSDPVPIQRCSAGDAASH